MTALIQTKLFPVPQFSMAVTLKKIPATLYHLHFYCG